MSEGMVEEWHVVGVVDGLYTINFDIHENKYTIIEKKTNRKVHAMRHALETIDLLATPKLLNGEYHICFELDAYRYRIVNQVTGEEHYAEARAFFVIEWGLPEESE